MLRKWFCIASVFAVAALMVAADATQARERRLFGRRSRGNDYNNSSYYGPGDYYAPRSGMAEGQRRSDYYPPEAFPATTQEMSVFIDVSIPANAEISFDGAKTVQKGSRRSFVSPPLKPGSEYTYEIKAQWMENGREITRSRKIPVRAGERLAVDLTRESPGQREQK